MPPNKSPSNSEEAPSKPEEKSCHIIIISIIICIILTKTAHMHTMKQHTPLTTKYSFHDRAYDCPCSRCVSACKDALLLIRIYSFRAFSSCL